MERNQSLMASYPDREAPRELLTRYAHALDLRHWADLVNVFTDDAVAEYSGYGAIDAHISFFTRRGRKAFRLS